MTSFHEDFEFLAVEEADGEDSTFPGRERVVTRTVPSKNSFNYYEVLL